MRRLRPSLLLLLASLAFLAFGGCATMPPPVETPRARPPRPAPRRPAARPASVLPAVRMAIVSKVDRKAVGKSFRFRRTTFEVGRGKRVYALVDLERLTPHRKYVARAYWHSPDGKVAQRSLHRFAPKGPGYYVWFWLDLSPHLRRTTGSWRVRLELDGRQVATRSFRLVRPADAVRARVVTVPHVDRKRVGDAFRNATSRFEVAEGKWVYALVDLDRLTPRREYVAKAHWYGPDGKLVSSKVHRFTPTASGWHLWFGLDLSPRLRRTTGSWRVRLELDGRQVATRSFRLVRPAGAVRARIVTVAHVDRNRVRDAFRSATSRFEVAPGRKLIVLVQVDGVRPGRKYRARVDIHRPDGRLLPARKNTLSLTPKGTTHYFWYSRRLDLQFPRDPGWWKARIYLDGRFLGERRFEVRAPSRFPPAAPPRRPSPAGPAEEFPSE